MNFEILRKVFKVSPHLCWVFVAATLQAIISIVLVSNGTISLFEGAAFQVIFLTAVLPIVVIGDQFKKRLGLLTVLALYVNAFFGIAVLLYTLSFRFEPTSSYAQMLDGLILSSTNKFESSPTSDNAMSVLSAVEGASRLARWNLQDNELQSLKLLAREREGNKDHDFFTDIARLDKEFAHLYSKAMLVRQGEQIQLNAQEISIIGKGIQGYSAKAIERMRKSNLQSSVEWPIEMKRLKYIGFVLGILASCFSILLLAKYLKQYFVRHQYAR